MSVFAINPISVEKKLKKRSNSVKYTGYGAALAGVFSVVAIKQKSPKYHKLLAYISGAFTLIHIALVEFRHSAKKV